MNICSYVIIRLKLRECKLKMWGLQDWENDVNIPVAPFKRSISGQSPSFKEIDNGQMWNLWQTHVLRQKNQDYAFADFGPRSSSSACERQARARCRRRGSEADERLHTLSEKRGRWTRLIFLLRTKNATKRSGNKPDFFVAIHLTRLPVLPTSPGESR